MSMRWHLAQAQVAEDPRDLYDSSGRQVMRDEYIARLGDHIVRHDPARVLREVEATVGGS
jgi:hypothetical protein